MAEINIVIEQHSDGYVVYPPGIQGVVVGGCIQWMNLVREDPRDCSCSLSSYICYFDYNTCK